MDTDLALEKQYWVELGHEAHCGTSYQECLNSHALIPTADKYCPPRIACSKEKLKEARLTGERNGIRKCNLEHKMYSE